MTVVEQDPQRRSLLASEMPGAVVTDGLVSADNVVVAVKPADGEGVFRSLGHSAPRRVLSVMAGVPTSRMESWLGSEVSVVRAMPNTPALVGAGMTAIAGGSFATEADLHWARELLGAVGKVVLVEERHLDAVTAVSGSGPAYLFYVVEAMISAGVAAGLEESISRELVVQTFEGSGCLLAGSGESPQVLRAKVTSPGGTTEAGIGVLDERKVFDAFHDAVAAAARRSRELGS